MAHFGLRVSHVARSKGFSTVAAAAYQTRSQLTDQRTGEVYDYRRAHGGKDVLAQGIRYEKDAPEWVRDRAELWNRAEAAEKRKDARTGLRVQIDLAHELTTEQNEQALIDWARQYTRKGHVVDYAIHKAPDEGDERNIHAHVIMTTRKLDGDGFARTKSDNFSEAELLQMRESWAHHLNRHLERHGHESRVDWRSLEAQGIDREPTKHKGKTVTEAERAIERGESDAWQRRIIEERLAEQQAIDAAHAKRLEREDWHDRHFERRREYTNSFSSDRDRVEALQLEAEIAQLERQFSREVERDQDRMIHAAARAWEKTVREVGDADRQLARPTERGVDHLARSTVAGVGRTADAAGELGKATAAGAETMIGSAGRVLSGFVSGFVDMFVPQNARTQTLPPPQPVQERPRSSIDYEAARAVEKPDRLISAPAERASILARGSDQYRAQAEAIVNAHDEDRKRDRGRGR